MTTTTNRRRLLCVLGLSSLTLGLIGSVAEASVRQTAPRATTCTGTGRAPGVLAGTYTGDVTVSGVCAVNAGQVVIEGSLTLSAGSALNATFGLDDATKSGYSNLTVDGDLYVDDAAVLGMGCDPTNSPCTDDPITKNPTLSSWDTVKGNLIATDALGVILHNSFIGGNLTEKGGGGGVNCTPTGIFVALKSPVFSDFENVVVGGNMTISGLRTCWLGSVRDAVHGNFTDHDNKMDDPDADEVNSNYVNGTLACSDNTPAVQYGDSTTGGPAQPNVVSGHATGECSFNTMVPQLVGQGYRTGPLVHISVSATA